MRKHIVVALAALALSLTVGCASRVVVTQHPLVVHGDAPDYASIGVYLPTSR